MLPSQANWPSPLHCVSGYPDPAEDYNLRTIPDMIERFDLVTALPEHTLDNTSAIASIALGACIVEKHFTRDRQGGGPDDSFSLEPAGQAGELITADCIRSVRPGYGMAPKHYDAIIGKRVTATVHACTPVKPELLAD